MENECRAITMRGIRCKLPAKIGNFCRIHSQQLDKCSGKICPDSKICNQLTGRCKSQPKVEAKRPPKVEAKRQPKVEAKRPTKVEAKRPTKVEAKLPSKVEAKRPTKVEAKRPTKVEAKLAPKVEAKLSRVEVLSPLNIARRKRLSEEKLLLNHATINGEYYLESIAKLNELTPMDKSKYIKSKTDGKKQDVPKYNPTGRGIPAVYTILFGKDKKNGFINTFNKGVAGIIIIINKRILLDKPFVACKYNTFGKCIYENLNSIVYGTGSYKNMPANIEKYANTHEFLFDNIPLEYIDAIIIGPSSTELSEDKSGMTHEDYLKFLEQRRKLTFKQICDLFPKTNVVQISKDDAVYHNLFKVYDLFA